MYQWVGEEMGRSYDIEPNTTKRKIEESPSASPRKTKKGKSRKGKGKSKKSASNSEEEIEEESKAEKKMRVKLEKKEAKVTGRRGQSSKQGKEKLVVEVVIPRRTRSRVETEISNPLKSASADASLNVAKIPSPLLETLEPVESAPAGASLDAAQIPSPPDVVMRGSYTCYNQISELT